MAEGFVERRIQQAQRRGFFDDLPGRGKPIKDLDTERPEGWWGDNFLRHDRALVRLTELQTEITKSRAAAWRLDDHEAMRSLLTDFNRQLEEINEELELDERAALLDVDAELAMWRRQRRARLWPDYSEPL